MSAPNLCRAEGCVDTELYRDHPRCFEHYRQHVIGDYLRALSNTAKATDVPQSEYVEHDDGTWSHEARVRAEGTLEFLLVEEHDRSLPESEEHALLPPEPEPEPEATPRWKFWKGAS